MDCHLRIYPGFSMLYFNEHSLENPGINLQDPKHQIHLRIYDLEKFESGAKTVPSNAYFSKLPQFLWRLWVGLWEKMETSVDFTSSFFGCGLRLSTELRGLGFKFARYTGPLHTLSPLAQAKLWVWALAQQVLRNVRWFCCPTEFFLSGPFASKYVFRG